MRGLAWRKIVSSMFLYVISFLGEFSLSPLEIALALGELLIADSVGRVGGGVVKGVCVKRVGGAERVLGVAGWGLDRARGRCGCANIQIEESR